jgi:hypothetical protein
VDNSKQKKEKRVITVVKKDKLDSDRKNISNNKNNSNKKKNY